MANEIEKMVFQEEEKASPCNQSFAWFTERLSAEEVEEDTLNAAMDYCMYLRIQGAYSQQEPLLVLLITHLLRKQAFQRAGNALILLGDIFLHKGLEEEAVFEHRQAAAYLKKGDVSSSLSLAQFKLASLLEQQEKNTEAAQKYLEAGSGFYDLNDYKMAEDLFSRAKRILFDCGCSLTASYAYCLSNLAMVYGKTLSRRR